jgi:hypothetical protein
MAMNTQVCSRSPQSGAVLVVALIFMALTALISAGVLNSSLLEVKMVGNEQFKEEAFQTTEGVLDAIMAGYQNNLPVVGDVGYKVCAVGMGTGANCDAAVMRVPSTVSAVTTGVALTYQAERLGPLMAPMPFRQSEREASSAGAFNVALYEVNAVYDGRAVRLGHHEVFAGVAIRVAASSQ